MFHHCNTQYHNIKTSGNLKSQETLTQFNTQDLIFSKFDLISKSHQILSHSIELFKATKLFQDNRRFHQIFMLSIV
jgi:hydrogenase maturation factor